MKEQLKMPISRSLAAAIVGVFMLSACSSSDDSDNTVIAGPLTEGVAITMRNTLEEGGPEATFPSLFGQEDDAYDENAVLSFTEVEFPTALAQTGTPVGDISGLYSIDIDADSIEFTLLPDEADPFWAMVFGVFPAGKFDRYYLTFSEPHNIETSASSNSAVNLRIDSDTVAVVEIGEGYEIAPGLTFSIDLN